jgi:hypothetical protein
LDHYVVKKEKRLKKYSAIKLLAFIEYTNRNAIRQGKAFPAIKHFFPLRDINKRGRLSGFQKINHSKVSCVGTRHNLPIICPIKTLVYYDGVLN